MKQTHFSHSGLTNTIENGLTTLFDAVVATMGPGGANVLIEDYAGDPHLTKDGVTVAEHVESRDHIENMAIKLVRQAARETALTAGDGTTTSVLLSTRLYIAGRSMMENENISPIELTRDMKEAIYPIIAELGNMKKTIDIHSPLTYDIAMISSNRDETIAKVVVDAYRAADENGVVKVEEGQTHIDKVHTTSGLTYRHDPISRDIFTNVDMKHTMVNAKVLVHYKEISSAEDIEHIIASLGENKPKRLVIFVKDIADKIVPNLVAGQLRIRQSGLDIVFVKLDGFGERKKDTAMDIAAYTGITTTESCGPIKLGEVDEIELTTEEIVLKRSADADTLKDHLEALTKAIDEEDDPFLKGKLEERVIKLSGQISTIYVGGSTEAEAKERKDRYDDTVAAVDAALKQGVVPGGGNALSSIYNKIYKEYHSDISNMTPGTRVVWSVLCDPLYQLIMNYYDASPDDTQAEQLASISCEENRFYHLTKNRIVDNIFEHGIVDPYLVTETALKNAVSAACNLLTTRVAITIDDSDKI